jgi:DNA primase
MPSYTEPMGSNHRQYLIRRGFDPDELGKLWNLVGTGPISKLDGLDFKHRIIIPIVWDQKEVSFTSRDITNKHPLRYITCPKDRELIHHKEIIYGRQEYWKDIGICVEGPTDVWRLGVNSFATFGIKYIPQQVRIIAKTFKRVAVVYDDDPQAVVQAKKLVADLRFRGVDAFHVPIVGDPGGMKQEDANYLIKQIIK